MKKRLIREMFCLLLTASLAAGCSRGGTSQSGETDSGTKEYKNFITVDVYDEFANYQGIQSGWFAKEVRDRFNMELNIIAPNVTGGGDTLLESRSATGSLGDLILVKTESSTSWWIRGWS